MKIACAFFALLLATGMASAQSRVGTYHFGYDVHIPEHKDREGRTVKALTLTVAPANVRLRLKADGTYEFKELEMACSGRYVIKQNTLYMIWPRNKLRLRSTFRGSDIIQDKASWRRAGFEGWSNIKGQDERFVKQPTKQSSP